MPASIDLWHRRLGHLNMAAVKQLSKVSEGMPVKEAPTATGVCRACTEGKQHRIFDRTPSNRATERLELVHSDLWIYYISPKPIQFEPNYHTPGAPQNGLYAIHGVLQTMEYAMANSKSKRSKA
jgi:hypothetical protein